MLPTSKTKKYPGLQMRHWGSEKSRPFPGRMAPNHGPRGAGLAPTRCTRPDVGSVHGPWRLPEGGSAHGHPVPGPGWGGRALEGALREGAQAARGELERRAGGEAGGRRGERGRGAGSAVGGPPPGVRPGLQPSAPSVAPRPRRGIDN